MDHEPGNLTADCELLRHELGPCIAGILTLCDRLAPDEIRRRAKESMACQRALLARLDRCAEAISPDSPLEAQVKVLRDAQRKLLCMLVERFGLSRSVGRGCTTRRHPLAMFN